MVAGGVVAAAAAAVTAAVTAAAAVAVTAMLWPAAVVVVDLQLKHCTGIKEVGGRPPLAQILLEDLAADVSFIAALSTDASGAVVSPVDGAASDAASDDAPPADDSRAPTAPLSGVAFDAAVLSAEAGALAAPPPM